jgi:hypothetical protein
MDRSVLAWSQSSGTTDYISQEYMSSYFLEVDSQFESSGTPINKLNRPTGLNRRDGLVSVPRDHVPAIQQGTSHVMRCAGITHHHLIMRLKTLESDILHTVTLVLSLGFGDDWRARDQGVVDTGVWHKIGLEFR